jgi:PKD repeat protein
LAGASAAAATDNVDYNGGPVSHSMSGVIVDWGAAVNPMYTNETSGDPGLIKYLSAQSGSPSDIGGVLAQYMDSNNQNAANQDSYGGQYQIAPSNTATTLMDSQIQTDLVNQIQSGHLPRPAGDGMGTIYLVLFPNADTECISPTECSANAPNTAAQTFCAYHNGTSLPDRTHVLYAVLPDNTTGHMSQWCGGAGSAFNNQTSYLTHEWSETISDPLGTAWWVNSSTSAENGNEIGDNCNQLMTAEGGWTVQQEWSNLDHNCVGGESAFNAPTASFLAPSTGQPGQPVSFDASSSSDPSADATAISGTSYSISSGLQSYLWNWGDGTSTASATPSATHTYAAVGNDQVSLTVTDHLGFTSTVTKTVSITVTGTQNPSARTDGTTGASATSVTVEGTINPENQDAQYRFVYGLTPGQLSQSTPLASGPAGQADTMVSATLIGLAPLTSYYYQLEVISGGQSYLGAVHSFMTTATPPPPQTPTVAIGGASQIATHSATVAGAVNPGGPQSVTYHFSYGTSANALSSSTAESLGPSGGTSVPIGASLSALQNHTTYYYRLDVTLSGRVYSGSVRSFTTQTQAPEVTTGAASRVTGSAATVAGTVAPNGTATSYHVEFGTTQAYGHSTPVASAGAGGVSVPVSAGLAGLRARTVYHYRLVASAGGATSVGADRTFTTGPALAPAPYFGFAGPARVALRAALHGRLRVRFHCSRGCTAHFVVTVASARASRFAPVAVTLAGGSGRVFARGSGTAALRFMPGVRARLEGRGTVKLVAYGYAVSRGSARSAPKTRRFLLG